ncbi:MAG: hypothetical protein V2B20_10735 [Pseudomonadota bacterium]
MYISTNSDQDLAINNNKLIKFEKAQNEDEELPKEILSYKNIWYVGSASGCSCSFRHLMTPDLGFSEPVDWYEEDGEDIEATKQLYDVLKKVLEKGKQVEIVDKWTQVESKDIKEMEISLSEINRNEFRFIENYKFILKD